MASSLWIKHLPAGRLTTVTPTAKLLVVNACLGSSLPEGSNGRGALLFAVIGSETARSVASFARDTSDQARLDLVLEANVDYVFSVEGPFPLDLIGHHPGAVFDPSEPRADSHSSSAEKPKKKPKNTSSTAGPEGSPSKKSKKNKEAEGKTRLPTRAVDASTAAVNGSQSGAVPHHRASASKSTSAASAPNGSTLARDYGL